MGEHRIHRTDSEREFRAFTQAVIQDTRALEALIAGHHVETSAASNSPVLMGRRLWYETRVALFERAVDARSGVQLNRGAPSRVTFGEQWVTGSLLELFQDNVTRYPVIATGDTAAEPLSEIACGRTPDLAALTLHNGTVWRWNRPCYGVRDGRAHLRIENRVLPAGPSVLDEAANAALFFGMMRGLAERYQDIPERLPFDMESASAGEPGPKQTVPVTSLMDPRPETISPDAPLAEAARGLASSRTGCLLVVANGKLLGILTRHDLARAGLHQAARPGAAVRSKR